MRLQVRNPYDGEIVQELAHDAGAALDGAIDRARAAQAEWRRIPPAERVRQVRTALGHFTDHAEPIAREVTRQMGKPIVEARREVGTLVARAEYMCSIAERALAPELLPGEPGLHLRIEHEPVGVVLDIAAWNYPLLVPVNVVVPALLAGNAVLLKPSLLTPLTGERFALAFAALSVPHLLTSLVVTDADAERLLADPRVDYVSFTGSLATGRRVYRAAAGRIVDVGLELGGKDPAYVAEDADLDFAVANLVDGACYNAGQSCCAVERAYVHERLYDAFLEAARAALGRYRLGDPLDEATTMGPLARRAQVAVLEAQVQDARGRGARLLCGGGRPPGLPEGFFAPTLLADVPNDAVVMQEESFGPLLPVAPVAGDDDALARMNDSRYGLSASVWTRSGERAERFARELAAGTVFQNRCDYLDPALAWTGWKESGLGSTLSRWGFAPFTRRKSVHLRDAP
jgi:acyl-CoA reductase-like NAD-dependent aldehyde dehydrogenase